MANGLLESPKQENDKCGGRIDLQYFKDLWSKGFVQDVVDYILYYWFKVHDLIHDLALNVSQEECLIIYRQTYLRLLELAKCSLEALPNSITTLKHSCPEFEALPNRFQNLTSLQRLKIIDCPKLSCLPDGVQRLASLSHLKIQLCPTLSYKCQPETGTDWSKISHIQEVHIENQKIINSR
ncbi:hypothetical protein GOBAR_DD21886 [Gossypium barbadense]|nr:hypothetical protein GOBAR_DD21886 [Gossypium barbadense]